MLTHLKKMLARRSLLRSSKSEAGKAWISVDGNESQKKSVVLLVALGVILLLMRRLQVGDYLSIAQLQEKSEMLLAAVHAHYACAVIVYILVYAGLIACALPAVAPMTILGGYLFGVVAGVIYAVIGASTGATVYFLLVRSIFAHTIRHSFEERVATFQSKMNRYGASYLISLQLLTIVPYFVINTLAALAEVPLITFVWTTVIGGIPLHIIYAMAGRELATLTSIRDILKPSIIVLLLLMAFMALLPMIIRFVQARRTLRKNR